MPRDSARTRCEGDVCGWVMLDAQAALFGLHSDGVRSAREDVKQAAMPRTWAMEERRSGTLGFWLPPSGCKAPKLALEFGIPRGGRRAAWRVFNHERSSFTTTTRRPIPRGAGRRAGPSGGGTRIGVSTRCSVPSAHTQSAWGDDRVAASYRPGHIHSARVGETVRQTLLMEWAGAGSYFVCTSPRLPKGGRR